MSFGTILCHQNLVVFFWVCSLEIQKSTAILEKKTYRNWGRILGGWFTGLNHLECFLFQVQKMNEYLDFGTVTGKNVWYLLGIIINENNGK